MGGKTGAVFGVGLVVVASALGTSRAGDPGTVRASIQGTVTFSGSAAPGSPVDMSSDPYCVDARGTPLDDGTVRTTASGGLRDVVIVLRDVPTEGNSAPAAEPEVLDQVECEYVPRVFALRTGQELIVRNSDRTLHNVHVTAENNRGFNIGQPLPGIESRRSFDAAENNIDVKCDIHGWMHGTIFVFDHPYHAVTDAGGRFTIPDVPTGTYTLEVWHETLGSQSQSVTVDAGGATVSVAYEGT